MNIGAFTIVDLHLSRPNWRFCLFLSVCILVDLEDLKSDKCGISIFILLINRAARQNVLDVGEKVYIKVLRAGEFIPQVVKNEDQR